MNLGGRPRRTISAEAIAEAKRFLDEAKRKYKKRGEPAHPSRRQLAKHLLDARLIPEPGIDGHTLLRLLERQGVAIPRHWRNRPPKENDPPAAAPRNLFCPSPRAAMINDGGPTRKRTRPPAATTTATGAAL